MSKVCLIVLDSVGIGALPDADKYGDKGANTLLHIDEKRPLKIPNLEELGIGKLANFKNIKIPENIKGCYGRMEELSNGKDTITGHWELAGTVLEKPFPVYPEGFPNSIIEKFKNITGREILGNKPASGTEIIKELGEEHIKTGALIVYTSADSVFQIAAHEDIISVKELYDICEKTREMLVGEHNVGRVIARPFIGENANNFKRTGNRKDFPLKPEKNILFYLKENGIDVMAVGKIEDIFAGQGITMSSGHNKDNEHGVDNTIEFLKNNKKGLIFTNLVDFDMNYGHRNDVEGYAKALEEFDARLPEIISNLKQDDILIITADHGCDPTHPGTDHTREYVPLIVYGHNIKKDVDLGTREGFIDVAATIAEIYNIKNIKGNSFLGSLK